MINDTTIDREARVPNHGDCDLTKFLAYLDPDSGRAAEEYVRLRRAITRCLQNRGSWSPEQQADETLEILCRKITKGELIADRNSYARAVALNVLKRGMWKESRFESFDDAHSSGDDPPAKNALEDKISFEAWRKSKAEEPEELKRARLECMRMCLNGLPSDDRKLMMEYDPKRVHDRVRREELAERYGMTPNLLRVRVCRIKVRLRRCRDECIDANSTPGSTQAVIKPDFREL